MPKLTYEVQDRLNGWQGAVAEGEKAIAANGMTGLDVTVDDNDLDVQYQAYYGNQWQPASKDGKNIGDGTTVFQAVRILIAPRRNNHHIQYETLDQAFVESQAMDDKPAGKLIANNGFDGLRVLQINLAGF
jgi:hypothetical protein